MKVWELMAQLSKYPAGTDVFILEGGGNEFVDGIVKVIEDDGEIIICGDGDAKKFR